jgi:hypothetical protein
MIYLPFGWSRLQSQRQTLEQGEDGRNSVTGHCIREPSQGREKFVVYNETLST